MPVVSIFISNKAISRKSKAALSFRQTGYLRIGGAHYCFVIHTAFSRVTGVNSCAGEDTDLERSRRKPLKPSWM
ncbi:hypothetical protein KCP69_10745 [Salmonella enterica subsp. enterica]|nr:hypothetical protein KCP69_10745 [Salmonella enterica subsp. enterica]